MLRFSCCQIRKAMENIQRYREESDPGSRVCLARSITLTELMLTGQAANGHNFSMTHGNPDRAWTHVLTSNCLTRRLDTMHGFIMQKGRSGASWHAIIISCPHHEQDHLTPKSNLANGRTTGSSRSPLSLLLALVTNRSRAQRSDRG